MTTRMSNRYNDVFYLCSLIDYIARITKNKRVDIVNALGIDNIKHIFELADVYHSDNIDRVASDFINKSNIKIGNFDNVGDCKYNVPTHWDIGKVYARLVIGIADKENLSIEDAVIKAYNSFVSEKIDDYNSAFYYDNPQNILMHYYFGMPYDKTLGAIYKESNI